MLLASWPPPFNNSKATRQHTYGDTSWDLLFILFCSITALFNPSTRKSTRDQKRPMKRRRQKYPCAKTPGSRPKYGKTNELWNVVYDPATDQVLTWSSECIRIYRRRGRRLYTYRKGQSEKTFPRHALPIQGIWQGDEFVVSNISHWTNRPTVSSLNDQGFTPTASNTMSNTKPIPDLQAAKNEPKRNTPHGISTPTK
jgi:hypothetical protein